MSYKSGELFLSLNDAVKVAIAQFDVDPIIARQELEQKCYVPCSDYEMGYYDGLAKARDAIINVMEGDTEEALKNDAVHGEWIKRQVFNPELDKYVTFIECSVCGYAPYYGGSESKFNYCSNCGSRMKVGENK